jgi:hypothetical protein
MRTTWIARAAAVALAGGALAACGPPGGSTPGAIIVITPFAPTFDLPPTGEGNVTVSLLVQNVGFENTGTINIALEDDSGDFHFGSPGGSCAGLPDLQPGDSCELRVTAVGHEPSGSYTATISVFGDEDGDTTVNAFIV